MTPIRPLALLLLSAFLATPSLATAAEASPPPVDPDPAFTIRVGERKVSYRRSELIRRNDLTTLTIDYDPSFPGKRMTYRAVPVAPLFEGVGIPKDDQLQFECLDGFSAPIDKERLLNASKNGAIAYLAIEMPGEKWPIVTATGSAETRTPAPYYLVWVNPRLSRIGPEEWPYQLAGFAAKPSIAAQYPAIVPDPRLSASSPVARGFKVFTKNCFPCHTINRQGQGTLGPDLNVPMNPTEYLTLRGLRTVIRDPKKLRYWPAGKMTGFGKDAISEAELSDLIAYLRHMAKRK